MLKLKITDRAGVRLVRIPEQTETIVQLKSGTYCRIDDKLRDYPQLQRFRGAVYIRIGSVLTRDLSVIKTAKTRATLGIQTAIHYGAPAGSAGMGIHSCSHATKSCSAFCLNTAGKGSLPSVQLARIARQRLRAFRPDLFWSMFRRELETEIRHAKRNNRRLYVRPNGTTDQFCPELSSIIDDYSDSVGFYDYTAVPRRLNETRCNYELIMSVKETESNHQWIRANIHRHNAAAVVLPALKNRLLQDKSRFFDADLHDLRIAETDGANGRCGLLTPKGQLRGKPDSMIFEKKRDIVAAVWG
jgi:hypothetical protein